MPEDSETASAFGRLRALAWPALSKLERVVVEGPDPVDTDEAPGLLETLLPWPLRLLVVFGLWALGRLWYDRAPAQQLAWALSYVGAIMVSLLASWWFVLFVANLALGLSWLGLTRLRPPNPREHPLLWRVKHLVEFFNRQLSHVEALFVWTAILLSLWPRVDWQLPALAALYLLAPPFINGAAHLYARRRDETQPREGHLGEDVRQERPAKGYLSKADGRLQAERRPFIYGATLAGVFLLVTRTADERFLLLLPLALAAAGGVLWWVHRREHAPARRRALYAAIAAGVALLVWPALDAQALNLLPLALAVATGAALRWFRHRVRKRQSGAGPDQPDVKAFRVAQRRFSRKLDVGLGPVLVIASLAALLVLSYHARTQLDAHARAALDGPPPPDDMCLPALGGPRAVDMRMLLVADSQFHELGGERFPGQMELADAVVPMALRPVELDMLSAAPLYNYGRYFERLATAPPPEAPPALAAGAAPTPKAEAPRAFWAHLGDLGDLSCTGEITRAADLLKTFPAGAGRLAGIAPGNHDMSFTGNFFWSPFWGPACASKPLAKAASIDLLVAKFEGALAKGGQMVRSRESDRWPPWVWGRGGALVGVTPLGPLASRDGPRGLAAIFVDTADGEEFDQGIAGLYGTFSAAQDRRLRALVKELPRRAGELYQKPVWLIFAHHPVAELLPPSRERLFDFIASLDGVENDGKRATEPGQPPPEPRALALITAHTHHAEAHRHCVGGRALREFVIGSTIDPPQQAALLEVGRDASDLPSVRVRTIPSVARDGFVCPGEPKSGLNACTCRRIIAHLKSKSECAPLFQPEDGLARDCGELEKPTSLEQRIEALAGSRRRLDPENIKEQQSARAAKLLACVCRRPKAGGEPYCTPPRQEKIFENEAYHDAILRRLEADKGREGRANPYACGAGTGGEVGTTGTGAGAGEVGATGAGGGAVGKGGEGDEPSGVDELTCLAWAAAAVQSHKASGMTFSEALRCAFDDPSLPAAQEPTASLEARACH
jgi:hypothetical protein